MVKFFHYFLIVALITLLAGFSSNKPTILQVKERTITINGKPAKIYRIEQPDGTWGFRGKKGEDFNVVLENLIDKPTVVHWHGLIDPNNQDGVPYVTQEPILPGASYKYNFKLKQAGTFWMHSHYIFQAQDGLSAPLILEDEDNVSKNSNEQEVIMFLTDFTFKSSHEIFQALRSSKPDNNMQNMNMVDMDMKQEMSAPDLNDVSYDAYLTNYKTLLEPEIIKVNPKTKVRLRIINAASASNFIINLGNLKGEAIAVDGEDIIPITGNKIELAMAQRIDIIITIPEGKYIYPILAQGEGTSMQTGIILQVGNAAISSLSEKSQEVAPALCYKQELSLRAKNPLTNKKIDRSLVVNLEGDMSSYTWKINDQVWPNVTPLKVKEGERIEIIFNNKTMMSHPMHLHGHTFQVTEINGQTINGAMRDTLLIDPNSTAKIQFDANNPGIWMLHCHNLYHAMAGMMTTVNYEGFKAPKFKYKLDELGS